MLIGDSLMQYQFDALLAWQRRAGTPLKCKKINQPELVWKPSEGADDEAQQKAIRTLLTAAKYDGEPQDCSRPGLKLYARRLNLLPVGRRATIRAFEALFAPLIGVSNAVAVVNVGLWYNPLSRHAAFDDDYSADGAALSYLRRGAASLVGAACSQRNWPRILWREATPQHFAGGGEYRHNNASSSCHPLSRRDAREMHEKVSRPVLDAVKQNRRKNCAVAKLVSVLPAFWPLVPRYRDHEGFRSKGKKRADCTHWLPCSGSMMLLNQLLVDGVVGGVGSKQGGGGGGSSGRRLAATTRLRGGGGGGPSATASTSSLLRGCTPGCKVIVEGFGNCGFRTGRDCPRPYEAADIYASEALWDPSNESQSTALEVARKDAELACKLRPRPRAPAQLRNGGFCVRTLPNKPPSNYTIRGADGRKHAYQLPASVDHGGALGGVTRVLDMLLKSHDGRPVRSLIDLGAGLGQYGRALLALDPRHKYTAFDGAGNVASATSGFVKYAEFSLPLSLPKAHWALSIDTGEHVPREHEMMFIRNLHVHACVGVILSWADLIQGGSGHVNNHSPEYLIKSFEAIGYVHDERLTWLIRNQTDKEADETGLLVKTFIAMRRRKRLQPCA